MDPLVSRQRIALDRECPVYNIYDGFTLINEVTTSRIVVRQAEEEGLAVTF